MDELLEEFERERTILEGADNVILQYYDVETKETLSYLFITEVTNYLLYLAASDGMATSEKVKYINIFSPYEFKTYTMQQLIITDKYAEDFGEYVPELFSELVKWDLQMCKTQGKLESLLAAKMAIFFSHLGEKFMEYIKDDSGMVEKRKKMYEHTVCTYIANNFESIRKEVSINDNDIEDSRESSDEEPLEVLLEKLNSLIGLDRVKEDVTSMINLLQIQRKRKENGMKELPMSLHLVFYGNPGTGKTTVARLLSKIYCRLGILSKGHLIEVDRSKLVAGYIGQTAIQVREIVEKAKGGILFIDEAYSLASDSENDFGKEAIDTLLKGMEDFREDLIVIVAGYPEPMEKFLKSNPGLISRFNKKIFFDDYTPNQLLEIFELKCRELNINPDQECLTYVLHYFDKRCKQKTDNFANARDVRNFFEKALINQANRLSVLDNVSNLELQTLTIEDVRLVVLD